VKVLWLSHFVPWPPRGGALQRSHNLLRRAASAHEVSVIALNQSALLAPSEIPAASAALSEFCASLAVFPIPSEASRARWLGMVGGGLLRTTPYDVNWLRSRQMTSCVREIARRGDVDLVHVDTLGLMPYAELFSGVPLVLNHHNVESQMMARRASLEQAPIRRRYLQFEAHRLAGFERRACPVVESNLVVSELDGERLRRAVGGVPIAVVENGVDIEFFSPGGVPVPKTILFVGGMDWYPNREAVRILVDEIWPRLAAADPGWRLTVVGRNPSPELLAAARDPRVTAAGFVDDVRPYLSAAEMCVYPIRDGGGTRLKVLDAFAMGKPLIATRLAVEGIEAVEEVHYLPAETADEFATRIRALAAQVESRRLLGREARALVERRYGWEQIGDRMLAAYDSAAAARRAGLR
jgi:glycosyltransferase involved in cell wall biosynthesis